MGWLTSLDPFNIFGKRDEWDVADWGGDGDENNPPAPPQYELPSWAQGLPEEQLKYIRQIAGQGGLQMPQEYGISSQALQNMLGYQPQQFQFPMEAIQQALDAQQAQQLQQYQNQIRPVLAQQGQLDSTYYANLLDRYLQGQQTSRLGNTANLLTSQAQQNYDLSKWLPTFQSGVAGQLAGVGGQKANVNQLNLTTPFQTYIPAFANVYGQGLQLGDREFGAKNTAWLQALDQYNQDQANQAAGISSIGQLLGAGAGALFAAPTGGLSMGAGALLGSSLGGTASTLFGGSGGGTDFGTALNYAYPQQQQPIDLSKLFTGWNLNFGPQADMSSLYNSNWGNPYALTGAIR